LDELGIEISYGDYIGYYETETRVRYYSVVNDGRVVQIINTHMVVINHSIVQLLGHLSMTMNLEEYKWHYLKK
jgi:hypothetical protein